MAAGMEGEKGGQMMDDGSGGQFSQHHPGMMGQPQMQDQLYGQPGMQMSSPPPQVMHDWT